MTSVRAMVPALGQENARCVHIFLKNIYFKQRKDKKVPKMRNHAQAPGALGL
jgi:hypothetical protein